MRFTKANSFMSIATLIGLALPFAPARADGIRVTPAEITLRTGGNCLFSAADSDGPAGPWTWRLVDDPGGSVHPGEAGKCLYFAPRVKANRCFHLQVSRPGRPDVAAQVTITVQARPGEAEPAPISLASEGGNPGPDQAGLEPDEAGGTPLRRSLPPAGSQPAVRASHRRKSSAILPSEKARKASRVEGATAVTPVQEGEAAVATSIALPARLSRGRVALLSHPEALRPIGNDPAATLGRGASGMVQKVQSGDGRVVAARKVFNRKKVEVPDRHGHRLLDRVNLELELHGSLSHDHIVPFLGSHQDDENIYLVMALAKQSLHEAIKPHGVQDEGRIRTWLTQLLEGLAYLHGMGIVHGDLKTENLLLDDAEAILIADFGSAQYFDLKDPRKKIPIDGPDHTILWAAPEMYGESQGYRQEVDIWALGCVIIELLSGKEPWHEKNFRGPFGLCQAMFHIANTSALPAVPEGASEGLRKFALRCLVRDPAARASAADLLKDPYLQGL